MRYFLMLIAFLFFSSHVGFAWAKEKSTAKLKATTSKKPRVPAQDSNVDADLLPVNSTAYIDALSPAPEQIFDYSEKQISTPGHIVESWKTCRRKRDDKGREFCANATGYLNHGKMVTIVGGPFRLKSHDLLTGKLEERQYYRIQFSYSRPIPDEKNGWVLIDKEGFGFIEKERLSSKPVAPFFTNITKDAAKVGSAEGPRAEAPKKVGKNSKKDLPQTQTPKIRPNSNGQGLDASSRPLNQSEQGNAISENMDEVHRSLYDFNDTADLISNLMGICIPARKDFLDKFNGKNIYDSLVAPALKRYYLQMPQNERTQLGKIKKSNGEPLSFADLAEIDASARTMVGEMASCFSKGLHYPLALMRIAMNRAEAKCQKLKNQVFAPDRKSSFRGMTDTTLALTTPSQFSMWKNLNCKNHCPLKMGLCPGRKIDERAYKGRPPSKYEVYIWKTAVKIAAMKVLNGDSFKEFTDGAEGVFYYTSGLGRFYNGQKVILDIQGRRLNNSKCMETWRFALSDDFCNGGQTPEWFQLYELNMLR